MKFWDNKGNIAVLAALSMPIVIGGAGLGVETGYWYYEQLRLQQAADAAAYVAALEMRAGASDEGTLAKAIAMATENGFDDAEGDLVLTDPSALETDETNSVDAELTREIPRGFTALFGDEPILIRAKATAAYSTAGNACVLALDKSASPAINFSGSSGAEMQGCVVMSNSIADESVSVEGSADVEAPCVMSVGGASVADSANLTLTECSSISTGQPPVADPYKDVPYPAEGTCTNGGGGVSTPGCYTGNVKLTNGTIAGGIYIIKGGSLQLTATSNVTGANVTFVFLDGATADFNNNAVVNLSAPTSGTYKGMLMMGSRTSGAGGISRFNGTPSSHLTGALYFPKQKVEYNGNFTGNGGCTQIVAATVSWSGNTHFNVNCTAAGLEPIQAGSAVRLIG